MDRENFSFSQILSIGDSKLWQMKDSHSNCCATGSVQILYSKSSNLFLLKFDEFYWLLDKSLQIIVTASEKEGWSSYMIPNKSGFFTIKINTPEPNPDLVNFETILSNTTEFLIKKGMEERLGSRQEQPEKKKGSGIFERFTKALFPLVSHDQNARQKQIAIKSFEELKNIEENAPVILVSGEKIQRLRDECSERKLESQKLSGTGLTSQSMGTKPSEEKEGGEEHVCKQELPTHIDSRVSTTCQDQQNIVGTENQRLPSYEVDQPKHVVEQGFEQASANLHEAEHMPSLTYLEENAFTSGLLAKKAKIDESRPREVSQDLDFLHRPYSYQLTDHDPLEIPVTPPSGNLGEFGSQYKNPRIKEEPLAAYDEGSDLKSKPLESGIVESDVKGETGTGRIMGSKERIEEKEEGGLEAFGKENVGV